MKPGTPALASILESGSFQRELVVDVRVGTDRKAQNVPVDEWSFDQDIAGESKTSAEVTLTYTDDFARSFTPKKVGDILAPFGAELDLYCIISAGGFTERVPLGPLRIESVPSGRDSSILFRDTPITVGSRVELSLFDRLLAVRRAQFRTLEQTPSLSSGWDELRRLSGMAVTRNVVDVTIPNAVVYGRSRYDAVQQIAGVLGGIAYVAADGTLTIIPDVPGPVVSTLTLGDDGRILGFENGLESEDVYNVVVGEFETAAGAPIHAEAAITAGALAVDGPYGENVIEYPRDQAQFITTQAAANAAVAAYLAKVSTVGQTTVQVECLFDPRLELGDVVTIERADRIITGRIYKVGFKRKGPMQLTLGVLDVTNL